MLLPIMVFAQSAEDRYTAQEKAWIKANPTVRFAVYPGGRPFIHADGDQSAGVTMEYLHAIGESTGLVFKPVNVANIGEAKLALQRHELDLLPVAPSIADGDVDGSVLRTRPYFVGTAVVMSRASTGSIFRLNELEGLHVAVRRDSLLHQLLKNRFPAITLVLANDAEDELHVVSSGMADAAIDVDTALLPLWRKMYFSNLHVSGTISDVVLNFRMGVRSDDAMLASIIDKSLAALTAKQTDDMMAKWMDDSDYGATSWRVHYRFHAPEITAALILLVALAYLYGRARKDRRRAKQSEEEKAMFLAVMSHEIRVPLSAVLSSVELLKLTRINKNQKELLVTASSAADALLRLIDDVLDLSKLEADGLSLDNAPTDISKLVRDMVQIVRHRIDEKGLQLNLGIDIPDDARVLLDATRIQQVMINLLTNAIKFTNHGSVTLNVALSRSGGDASSRKLLVSVCDTGIGIPPEQHTRLFHAYVQADSTIARRYGGTGLGLSISRQLIELMDGTITLHSEVNVGTTISFSIPVQLAPAAPVAAPLPAPPRAPSRTKDISVLLVEDHPAIRFVFEQQLRSIGCLVTACPDGASALRMFDSNAFDLVLMDCGLPDISGYEVTRAMRKREMDGHHTPILALSASTDAAHKMTCIESGMDGLLKKPLELSLLRSEIQVWCDVELPDPGVDDDDNIEASR
ncbi:hybrid sensor histidine kinase/response regulator [Dyella sp.]|uniref:hybrid sensor histidine kinase/response regulator n=1 Tax=Dyella sp. TaxID=1869338 RepID=UPI002B4A29A2|nr:ATP-binding protein [Dyella sp.]